MFAAFALRLALGSVEQFLFDEYGPGMVPVDGGHGARFDGTQFTGRRGIGALALCGPVLARGTGTYSIEFALEGAMQLDPGTRVGVASGDADLARPLGRTGSSWGYAADGDVMHGGAWLGQGAEGFLERFRTGDTLRLTVDTGDEEVVEAVQEHRPEPRAGRPGSPSKVPKGSWLRSWLSVSRLGTRSTSSAQSNCALTSP